LTTSDTALQNYFTYTTNTIGRTATADILDNIIPHKIQLDSCEEGRAAAVVTAILMYVGG